MPDQEQASFELSPRWRLGVLISVLIGFAILSWIAVKAYSEAPPVPEQVVSAAGETIFTGADIRAGQQVFLRYGLMENGTIWGHGAYLGPDFSAATCTPWPWRPRTWESQRLFGRAPAALTGLQRDRMPGDLVFIFLGVVPMVLAALLTYRSLLRPRTASPR